MTEWRTDLPAEYRNPEEYVDVTYSNGKLGSERIRTVRDADFQWIIAWAEPRQPYQPPPPEPDASIPACVKRFMAAWDQEYESYEVFSAQSQRDLAVMRDAAMKWHESRQAKRNPMASSIAAQIEAGGHQRTD